MITAKDTLTGDTWTYSYDFRNQMTGAVETNSAETVLSQVTYTYDVLDNRIGMDENGTQTWTLYDGSTPVMDFNGSGSLTMRYLDGPAGDIVDTVLARQSAGGTVAWYLPDRLGTIRDLINNSGAIIDHVDYSAFGTQLDESNPTNGDRMMGFAGLERDTVPGLNLAVYRVEDPAMERWTSQDPLGFNGGDSNLSRYVHNHPTLSVDQLGLKDWGQLGGKFSVAPNFDPKGKKITFIFEDYERRLRRDKPAQSPLPSPGQTIGVDSILIQGQGMYKIRNGCTARLTNDLVTGEPVVIPLTFYPTSRYTGWGYVPVFPSLGVSFYPIGTGNPMGAFGDIPGDEGGDESKINLQPDPPLPRPSSMSAK